MADPQIEPGTIITGGEAPPWATAGTSSSPAGAPSPPAGQVFSGGDMPPWQQARDNALEADAAGFTEAELSRPRIKYEAPKTEDSWLNWGGRIVRSASFGLPDLLSARIIQNKMRDEIPDLTYKGDVGRRAPGVQGRSVHVRRSGGYAGAGAPYCQGAGQSR